MRRLKEAVKEKSSVTFQFLFSLFLIGYSALAFFAYLNGNESFFYSPLILELLLIFYAILIIYDAIRRKQYMRSTHFAVGLLLGLFGAFPLAVELRLLRFLPFTIDLTVEYYVLVGALFFGSLYFVLDKFTAIFRNHHS